MRRSILFSAICFTILIFTFSFTHAQRWKKMRYELVFGTGATNFLGELGGSNTIGRDLFWDLDFISTRPAFNGGLRYKLTQKIGLTGLISYGWISGSDKYTKEFFRNNRNLHFRSPIAELSVYSTFFFANEQVGQRYKLRGVKRGKNISVNFYPLIGVSVFYFNPRAKYIDGKWHSLQPLSTEGEGLVKTRKPYSRVQVSIPFGLGFRYVLNRKFVLSVEYAIRKTFTDYLDDVSTTYFDPAYITAQKGPIAAYFSNPSTGPYVHTAAGQQRGDPTDKDSYMFMNISLNYKLTIRKSRRSRPKF